jgi:hypothetical protein
VVESAVVVSPCFSSSSSSRVLLLLLLLLLLRTFASTDLQRKYSFSLRGSEQFYF